MTALLQVFKSDGRLHWQVLRDGVPVGFIARRGNGRSAVRFVAVLDGQPVEPGPRSHGYRGWANLAAARQAVQRTAAARLSSSGAVAP